MKKNPLETTSPAKLKCIEFMRAEDNKEFIFTVPRDEVGARKFVQHMRVELGRFRTLLRDHGLMPKDVKMRVREFVKLEDLEDGTPQTRIVMFKQTSDENIAVDIAALFPELVSSIAPANVRTDTEENTEA